MRGRPKIRLLISCEKVIAEMDIRNIIGWNFNLEKIGLLNLEEV